MSFSSRFTMHKAARWRFSGLLSRHLVVSPRQNVQQQQRNASSSTPSTSFLHPVIEQARTQSTADHLDFDREHLWHPYTSLVHPHPVLPVQRAQGCTLYLEDGAPPLIDGMSSWWAAVWGYQHADLNAALRYQLDQKMAHVMFGGLTHRPAAELAACLRHMLSTTTTTTTTTTTQLDRVFLCDSGSVAVEVALKMAVQYHQASHNNSKTKKTKILSVRGGYHGDTLGAMSVCDPDKGMHQALAMVPTQVYCARPPCDPQYRLGSDDDGECGDCSCRDNGHEAFLSAALLDLETTLQEHHASLAAMIVEPIVQGAGGMRFYSPRYLQRARQLCDEYDVLLICDKIATGFGRSSSSVDTDNPHWFASLEADVEPDILCLGKALTGGYLTLGAVVTSPKVAHGVSGGDPPLPLMHGPTFMANPLACSVAVASMNLMLQPYTDPSSSSTNDDDNQPLQYMWKHHVSRIERQLRDELAPAAELETVADVRVRGAIGVIELKQPVDAPRVVRRCQELGVWLRPFGKLLYTMPPYIMTSEELRKVTQAMITLAREKESR